MTAGVRFGRHAQWVRAGAEEQGPRLLGPFPLGPSRVRPVPRERAIPPPSSTPHPLCCEGVGLTHLDEEGIEHGRKTGHDYTRAIINSQVVPSYDDLTLAGVREYRALMDKNNPVIPHSLRDPGYTPQRYSFVSLEGFINAKVIVEGLRRAGPELTRHGFRQGLESLHGFDLGIGAPLSFGAKRHQGLDSVYFTHVENNRWVPITDWKVAMNA